MLESKKAGRPSKKPSIEELDFLYQSMTAKELSEHYGVTVQTIRKWIADYRKERNRTKC